MRTDQADYDSPWKEALERYFIDFMAFFFPRAHDDIDWDRGYEFLDKELQKVVRDARLGRRMADKLVKVWRKEGQEAWVLVHIEVQGQEESEFAERMYVYHYRLYDRYRRQVVSLAVLGDEREEWRPEEFGYELWGCRAGLKFPTVKLLDYQQQWPALEESRNPFATVVMTHLKAQETRRDAGERKVWKLALTRRLYEQGYPREDILNLFRLIDWILWLPEEVQKGFWEELQQYEEEKQMPYISSVERIGMEKGMQKGLQQGLHQGSVQAAREDVMEVLMARFEKVPSSIADYLNSIEDRATLRALLRKAATIGSREEFEQALSH